MTPRMVPVLDEVMMRCCGPAHWTLRTFATPRLTPAVTLWSPVFCNSSLRWTPSLQTIATRAPSGDIATCSRLGSRPKASNGAACALAPDTSARLASHTLTLNITRLPRHREVVAIPKPDQEAEGDRRRCPAISPWP